MRFLVLLALCAWSAAGAARAATHQDARWQQHAQNVRIVRDNWGIAHIYGKSDADTVFRRHLRAGRGRLRPHRAQLSQRPGLSWRRPRARAAIYSDLRARLFVDPVQLQATVFAQPGVAEAR
jgi:acyl-homoserine-lactone acylase